MMERKREDLSMTYIIIGAGSRGTTYGTWAHKNGHTVIAVAELRPDRLNALSDALEVPEDMRFGSAEEILSLGQIADAAIIATQDRDHYGHVMAALDAGSDVLLEKPISPSPRECMEIEAKANELGQRVTVCHVLRYTNFFSTLKNIIDSGELGKIVAIKHSENIGSYHFAHSFVRGNWRREDESSPIILAKSCHDLDILLWLTGSHCTRVSAFGGLSHFRPENAPAGSADRCLDCPVAANCHYDARQAYIPALGGWPTDVVCLEQTEEALLEALEEGPYGRCVYRCDNDVCDHMSMAMEFENGVTATFSLTAQTNAVYRHIHIMCEHGEIEGDGMKQQITVRRFAPSGCETFDERVIHIRTNGSGHGGGDAGIMEDFTNGGQSRSSISNSVESHLMAGALEQSRLTGRVVDMAEYRKSIME